MQSWLMWRYEPGPNGKPLKVPYWTDGGKRYGRQGSPEDRSKLTTFDAARSAAARRGMDGVGLALLPGSGITALDFDNCVGPGGAIPAEVEEIVSNTYAEYSPSGNGVRAFVKGELGNRKSATKDGQYGFETFSSSGFVTVTGNMLPFVEPLGLENEIADATEAVHQLYAKRFGAQPEPRATAPHDLEDPFAGYEPALGLSLDEITAHLKELDPSMGRDEWIRVGMALHHETEGDDTGFALWDEWSSGGYQYPGSEALQTQWDSFTRRAADNAASGRRPITMASVIKMANAAKHARSKALTGKQEVLRPAEDAEAMRRAYEEALGGVGEPQGAILSPKGTPPDFTGKFKAYPAGSFSLQEPPPWLIKNLLPKAGLGVLFGASGSGKSFLAIDMAMAMVQGQAWRERRTKPASVVYIAAEGEGGIALRFRAYAQQNDVDLNSLPICIIPAAPNFLLRDEVEDVARTIAACHGADLIIIDTFAQVTPGANENGAEDMGRAIANMKALHKATTAMVLIVHHAGKDASKGARGWSGIRAAADVEIEVVRTEKGERFMRVSKMKDGEDGGLLGFTLETVRVGIDADGDEVTSCVVKEAEAPASGSSNRRLGAVERLILEHVDAAPGGIRQTEVIEKVIAERRKGRPTEGQGSKRDNSAHNTKRTINGLIKKGILFERDGLLSTKPFNACQAPQYPLTFPPAVMDEALRLAKTDTPGKEMMVSDLQRDRQPVAQLLAAHDASVAASDDA